MPPADIALLDSSVIDQIAAGEVVERPGAVLKELLENALDADASHIEVDIADGGLSLLQIQDNGHGMTPANAERALLRHATSKLRTLGDLDALVTCGFRGEALSSIAAVSRLTLLTRPRDAQAGFRVEMHGGELISQGAAGAPVGTTLIVRDLFYNVPARRKFLRSPATEQAHCVEALLRVLLGARRASATLRSQQRRLIALPDEPALLARLRAAFGPRLGDALVLEGGDPLVQVSGVLIPPEPHRVGTLGLWCFVNGRFVRERMVARALGEGLGLDAGSSLQGFVFIDVDAQDIDINVHPQKLEVRFSAPQAIYRALAAAAHKLTEVWPRPPDELSEPSHGTGAALGAPAFAPPAPVRAVAPRPLAATRHVRPAQSARAVSPADIDAAAAASLPLTAPAEGTARALRAPSTAYSTLEPLAEAPAGHLACRRGEDLVLIDCVPAHAELLERSLADADGAAAAALPSTQLVVAPAWTAPEALAAVLDDYAIEAAVETTPAPWGLELTPVGPERWLIARVPTALAVWAEPEQVASALAQVLERQQMGARRAWQTQRTPTMRAWCTALAALGAPWSAGGEGKVAMRQWLTALGAMRVSLAHARVLATNLRFSPLGEAPSATASPVSTAT